MPAKTVYSVPLHEAFIAKLKNLNGFVAPACDACGISRSTMQRWRVLGQLGQEPFATLERDILMTKASKAEKRMAQVEAHAEEDPGTARWLAERTLPAELGMRDKLERAVIERLELLLDAICAELDMMDQSGASSDRLRRAAARVLGGPAELGGEAEPIEAAGELVEQRSLSSGDSE